ncbi:MAG TPA: glycosyltransferase family 4 protein [Chitinophagaceae bacterium]|nr:glycosyltransferase family 4 protein [Chitinophagaceae bacterium]
MKKLAIITTHPIQYNAPLFKLLSANKTIHVKVFYTWGQAEGKIFDPGFGKIRQWDIPLLEGYEYTFVKNIAKKPGSHHFKGINNPALIDEIEVFKPHVLLVFGWSFQSHLKAIKYFYKKIPVIFRGDSTLLDEKKVWSLKRLIRKVFLSWVYGHIDYALYTGTANKKYFQNFGLKETQLVFAPHAIDTMAFYDETSKYKQAADAWRTELGIKESDVVFLFAGKLEPKKNLELLITAFQQITRENAWLIVVGNGILEQILKLSAKDNKRIIFLPFQNQTKMPVVYRLGNVFILPSRGPSETWGLAVNEAMACGRPVIVSDKCGCAADLVKNGKNGFIFNSTSVSELTAAMNFFLNNPEKIRVFGKVSYTYIQNWNYDYQVKAITSLVTCETSKSSLL